MSVRIVLLIAALVLAGGNFAGAADKPAKSVCAEHVKAMKGMKTADERTAYCKEHADCESNHCMSKMGHHKSAKKSTAPSSSSTMPPK
ncbi:MAG TPA: hypothetical protein VMR86_09770 [Myxococcota bacterium]|nr:hypothetical protein [Myxococcota bacterium]